MNIGKVHQAINLLMEAVSSEPSTEDYEKFGRATAAAIWDRYDVLSVVRAPMPNPNWGPAARNLWNIARRLGIGSFGTWNG